MLDIGWTELMVIGLLALLVVGPKELPRLLRSVGQFVAKARGMAREFQRSMEDAAREADLKEFTDLKRDIDRAGRVDFREQAKRSSSSLSGSKKAGRPAASESGEQAASPGTASNARPAEAPAEPSGPAEAPSDATADRVEPASPPERKAASGER